MIKATKNQILESKSNSEFREKWRASTNETKKRTLKIPNFFRVSSWVQSVSIRIQHSRPHFDVDGRVLVPETATFLGWRRIRSDLASFRPVVWDKRNLLIDPFVREASWFFLQRISTFLTLHFSRFFPPKSFVKGLKKPTHPKLQAKKKWLRL